MTKTLKQKALTTALTGILAVGCAGAAASAIETSNPQTADAATTWQQSGNRWWYQKDDSYSVGWDKINGSWYYFDNSGWMQTGWQKVGGSWYYLNLSGAMATGWKSVNGVWYYLNSSGVMMTGWQKIGGTWYYLNSSGAMATGWKQLGGTWYYLNPSGAMVTGWNKVGNDWYYHDASGAMQSNKWVGDYYVGGSGAMSTNTWIGNYYVGSDGKWQQNASNNSSVNNNQTTRTEIDWTKDAVYNELDDGTLHISIISTDYGTDIVIPDQIDGKYVSEVVIVHTPQEVAMLSTPSIFISSLDFSNTTHLKKVRLEHMHFLTSIDLSNCRNLETLWLTNTHVKNLDLTDCDSLTDLSFDINCSKAESDCPASKQLTNPVRVAKYPNLRYVDPTVESIVLPSNNCKYINSYGRTGIYGLGINGKTGEWSNLNNLPVYNLPDPATIPQLEEILANIG